MILSRKASFVNLCLALMLIFISGCQSYRPVLIPEPSPGPDPQAQKVALVFSAATLAAATPQGFVTAINLSGDTNMGQVKVGVNPIHGALIFSNARTLVANQGDDTASVI